MKIKEFLKKWIKRILIVSVMMICGQWNVPGSLTGYKKSYVEPWLKTQPVTPTYIRQPEWAQPQKTTYAPPPPTRQEPRRETRRETQPRATQVTQPAIQPFDFSGLMAQYQPTEWTPPTLPQAPQVTQAMIAEWQKRARGEASMQFDPQLLAIQQELEKMLLGAEQAKGGLEPAYQEVVDYIKEWQEKETGATQRRYYARGLGRGGGLTGREGEIAEQALKEVTAAGTERARKISDIESQKLLMMEQAGAKKEEIEVQRGRYIAARGADLREAFEQNRKQLEQQRFTNQMNIAQVGMTREAEEFNRYLGTMSAANEIWYRNQALALEQQSMALGEKARTEALQWQKEQAGTLTAYQQATLAQQGQVAGITPYQEKSLAQQQAQFEAEMGWKREQAGLEPTLTPKEIQIKTAAEKSEWDKYLEAFYPRYDYFKEYKLPSGTY